MDEKQYLSERLQGQIDWYDKKSATNKRLYRICQLILIFAATLVTLSGIVPIEEYPCVSYLVPILGGLIAVVSGVLGLYKYQEKWLEYRMTAESLNREKYLFATKSKPYHISKPFELFVIRIEAILANENDNWSSYMRDNSNENN